MPRPASLSLAMPPSTSAVSSTLTSPVDAGSGFSSPDSATAAAAGPGFTTRHHKSSKSVPFSISGSSSPQVIPGSPELTSLPTFPSSPQDPSKYARDSSKGFFSNLKASKSSNKVPGIEPSIRQISEEVSRQGDKPPQRGLYALRRGPGSTPDLSLTNFNASPNIDTPARNDDRSEARPMASSVGSDGAIPLNHGDTSNHRKPKSRFPNLVGRNKSNRTEGEDQSSKPTTPVTAARPLGPSQLDGGDERDVPFYYKPPAPRTAPLRPDRSLRDMMSSNFRGQSNDRPSSKDSNENRRPRQLGPHGSAFNSTTHLPSPMSAHPPKATGSRDAPGSREGPGSKLFANMTSKAAEGIGRARKGLLRRMERRPSNIGREPTPPEPTYVIKTINLPLIEQTRKTRIAGRIEVSRDKTEFWMPAIAWRCVDYLNKKGPDVEGIYRVPGSSSQIQRWQQRFDRELDIDLNHEPELYDVNIIGSMFKAWLRDLPDEIFPKETQARIARENPGARVVPQMMKDELSQLPPWNYYLLFAITCHLSLLTGHSNVNKMTYKNLCVCFQPALGVDSYCFRFLVEQWRDCWQGCYTETDALEQEYAILDADLEPLTMEEFEAMVRETEGLEIASEAGDDTDATARERPPALDLDQEVYEPVAESSMRGRSEYQNGQSGTPTMASRVPELAPMEPLSPIMTEFKNSSPEKHQHTQPRG